MAQTCPTCGQRTRNLIEPPGCLRCPAPLDAHGDQRGWPLCPDGKTSRDTTPYAEGQV